MSELGDIKTDPRRLPEGTPIAEGWKFVEGVDTPDDGWEWALVEIMGFRKHVGRIREVERFGAKLMRLDEPIYMGREEGDRWPYKIVDLRLDHWVTHHYASSALFGFSLSDETTVMALAQAQAKIARAAPARLPAPETERHDEHAAGADRFHEDDFS
jgi:hypothetical protein